MKSALAVTHEVDDVSVAASDLVKQVQNTLPMMKNRCGILFAESGYDWKKLLPTLCKETETEIIGCTASAQISTQGYHSLSATLLVLGGEDCFFATAATQALHADGADQIRKAFGEAKQKLGDAELQLVIVFSSATEDFTSDERLAVLDELAGGKPIFGGVASDYHDSETTKIIYNNEIRDGAIALMLVAGNVKPKLLVRNIPRKHLAKSKVTASHGHTVESIDGTNVYEFMTRYDVDTDNSMGLFYAPLTLEMENEEDYDGESVCRPFVAIDKESGIGKTIATVPEGSSVAVQIIQSDDIVETTRDAMSSVVNEITQSADSDYEYSTILGVTCAGRHSVLSYDYTREGELAMEILPAHINFSGFYSFGEYCPTSIRNGKAKNRLHNLSFTLCVL